MKLVIVESPAKAKTINKCLGSDYEVIASYGHIRDLPSREGSVIPDENFRMNYAVNDKALKHIKIIAKSFKSAESIFLATDPDREGESIAWHIVEAMRERKSIKKNVQIKRVIFNEITKSAVISGINNPIDINIDLVNAQQARRALDYLYGFTLSPVLWRKLPGSRSAGRVQSAALRIICDREKEIEEFISTEYWSACIDFLTKKNEILNCNITHINENKLDKFTWNNKESIEKDTKGIEKLKYHVFDIEKKKISRNPQPPFITSTLQQEAA
ncbi:MAG: DNA topoisomerase I, partial [Rickettsiales bacterium]